MNRRAVLRWMGRMRLDRLPPRLWRGSVLVLMYHYFAGDADDHLVVDETAFREQMVELAARFRVVRLPDVLERMAEGESLREPSVALTVDDVGTDFEDHAWPILREMELPVTLGICPGLMEASTWSRSFGVLHAHLRSEPRVGAELGRIMSRPAVVYEESYDVMRSLADEDLRRFMEDLGISDAAPGPIPGSVRLPLLGFESLRNMAATGLVDVASHTHTHPVLGRISGDWLRWELEESRRRIEAEVGECRILFHPGGAAPARADRDLPEKVGYRWSFGVRPDVVNASRDVRALGRVAIQGGEDSALFRARACGWPALLRRNA